MLHCSLRIGLCLTLLNLAYHHPLAPPLHVNSKCISFHRSELHFLEIYLIVVLDAKT